LQVKGKKKLILGIALVVAVFMAGALAQTFFFIFNETPFSPNQYNWQAPFEIKEMVDFVDAQLTLTGCGYEGQNHIVELVLTNVATVADYYLTAFTYSAKWYVDEANQENIIAGTYTGEPLASGESVTYTGEWIPTKIGVGVVKLNVIDIIWSQSEPITWTTEYIDNTDKIIQIRNFVVTGASVSIAEPGTVSFELNNKGGSQVTIQYTLEIVELSKTIATVTGLTVPGGDTWYPYSHGFDALMAGGAYTMRLTVTKPP
jgi:hypothetical protein